MITLIILRIQVCEHFQKLCCAGRRSKKAVPGRPKYCPILAKVHQIAPDPLLPSSPSYIKAHSEMEHVLCPLCTEVLSCPIETECGSVLCADCLRKWVQVSASQSCPCCYTNGFSEAHIRPPSIVVTNLLKSLLVKCEKPECCRVIRAELYSSHLQSGCKEYFDGSVNSPSKVTIGEILAKETSNPVTPAEKKVAEKLIKRMMADSPDPNIVHVQTRGQVSYIIKHAQIMIYVNSQYPYYEWVAVGSEARRPARKPCYWGHISCLRWGITSVEEIALTRWSLRYDAWLGKRDRNCWME